MRQFDTGATRDDNANKLAYEGFLSPHVLGTFAAYMHRHRVQADGGLRDADNWQKGIPSEAYMDSLMRHVMETWTLWRDNRKGLSPSMVEALCAMMFNVQGLLLNAHRAGIRLPDEVERGRGEKHPGADLIGIGQTGEWFNPAVPHEAGGVFAAKHPTRRPTTTLREESREQAQVIVPLADDPSVPCHGSGQVQGRPSAQDGMEAARSQRGEGAYTGAFPAPSSGLGRQEHLNVVHTGPRLGADHPAKPTGGSVQEQVSGLSKVKREAGSGHDDWFRLLVELASLSESPTRQR